MSGENQPTPNPQEEKMRGGIPMERDEAAKPEEKPEKPEKPAEKPEEKKPEAPEAKPPKEGEPKPEPKPEAKAEKQEVKPGQEAGKEKPDRPARYIPVKQYTDEKRQWKEADEKKEARIKELETLVGDPAKADTEKRVKDYAEKHGVSEESVRDLLEFFGGGKEVSKETKAEIPPEMLAEVEEAREIKAEKLFETEFTDVAIPQLKELFPDATDEQIKAAREEIRQAALTDEYLDKSLDYIVFREKDELAPLFAPKNPGLEKGRQASTSEKKGKLSVEDFKDGNNFHLLTDLSLEERDAIVKDFPLDLWTKYKNWVKQNDELNIN